MRTFILYLMAVLSSTSMAAECPLIRPPGLTPRQVDAVVVGTYSQALRTRPESLNPSKTLKALDGTENAILTYSFATNTLGETLGFDAGRRFFDAAKVKGAMQPFDSLTISEIMALARAEYAKGVDSSPPLVAPGMEFKVHNIAVRPPEPVQGWKLIRCGSENVVFQRQAGSGAISTAAVRVTALPPYKSNIEFLELVKSMWTAAIPAGLDAGNWQPIAAPSGIPCADTRFTASSSSRKMYVRGKVCYASAESTFGYATFYGSSGLAESDIPPAEGDTFVSRNSPR